MKNDFAIHIPYAMGIIGTRSLDKQIPGIKDIIAENHQRIESGRHAVTALEALRRDHTDTEAQAVFRRHQEDLGFGLLLKQYTDDVQQATPQMVAKAARDSVPTVWPMFWTFRIMVACGMAMLLVFGLSFWSSLKGTFAEKRWLLKLAAVSLPLPWLAIESGWFVAEYGCQPWTIYGVLPTDLSASSLSVSSLYGSLAGFIAFYTVLLIIEVYLMQKYIRLGPGSLGTGRYDNEAEH